VDEARLAKIAAWVASNEGLRIGPEGAAALAAVEDLEIAGAFTPGEKVVVFQTGSPDNYV
jgi:threonine synthase